MNITYKHKDKKAEVIKYLCNKFDESGSFTLRELIEGIGQIYKEEQIESIEIKPFFNSDANMDFRLNKDKDLFWIHTNINKESLGVSLTKQELEQYIQVLEKIKEQMV